MDTIPCSKCQQPYDRDLRQQKRRERICGPCRKAYNKAYRQRRKDEGRPCAPGGKMSPAYHQAYQREWLKRPGVRERNAEKARIRRADPVEQMKIAARRLMRSAIEMGRLIRQPCEQCGDKPADGHHDDYGRPLEVRWLCRLHHRAIHPRTQEKARG